MHRSDLLRKLRFRDLISTSYTPARFLVHSMVMRASFLMLLVLAGCPQASEMVENAAPFDGGAFGSGAIQCMSDEQCVPAAPTCCECPTFAVSSNDPLNSACSNIACPMPMQACPTNVKAACSADGFCELACVATSCPASCPNGYAMDANGCLTCDCAPTVAGGCQADGQCVEVPADCCGCARGGVDTAVLAPNADAFENNLNCPMDPQCPTANTCAPSATPQCIQGQCTLSTGVLPATACGRADLMACPSPQVCTINSDPDATVEGVGVCAIPGP